MPFYHIVLFQWKEDATPFAIYSACAALKAMVGQIPGVLDVRVGKNVTARTPHTHGLLVVLESEADLAAYDAHPVHQDIVQNHIVPIKSVVNAIDFTDNVF
jgi:chaperone required for assembly of F1-ATPase